MEVLVRDARASGATVMLSTLSRQRRGAQRAWAIDQIEPFNLELARIARASEAVLVDIYPEITMDLLAPDGLHLTEAGNQQLANIYLDALRGKFEVVGYPPPPPKKR